jgi:hypothetical protein
MKSSFCFAVTAVVVLGMSAAAMARGGREGGGGGSHANAGGERRDANDSERERKANSAEQHPNHPGARENKLPKTDSPSHASHDREISNANVQNHAAQPQANYANTSHPFSPAWYAGHPNAWPYTHPHADAWAVATLASTAAWLGLPALNGGDTAVVDNTVTTADTGNDQDDDNEDGVDEDSTSDPAAARQLAALGATDNTTSESFLPLGVFALAPENQKESAALVQLAVNKEGILRGTYYDVLTNEAHAIQGAVDKKSQRVAFTIGAQGKTVFETQLVDLTESSGELSLHFANGEATDWTLSRYDADPSTRAANH